MCAVQQDQEKQLMLKNLNGKVFYVYRLMKNHLNWVLLNILYQKEMHQEIENRLYKNTKRKYC